MRKCLLILAAVTFLAVIFYARFRYDVWFARWATGIEDDLHYLFER
jgi:hypothetical protein